MYNRFSDYDDSKINLGTTRIASEHKYGNLDIQSPTNSSEIGELNDKAFRHVIEKLNGQEKLELLQKFDSDNIKSKPIISTLTNLDYEGKVMETKNSKSYLFQLRKNSDYNQYKNKSLISDRESQSFEENKNLDTGVAKTYNIRPNYLTKKQNQNLSPSNSGHLRNRSNNCQTNRLPTILKFDVKNDSNIEIQEGKNDFNGKIKYLNKPYARSVERRIETERDRHTQQQEQMFEELKHD